MTVAASLLLFTVLACPETTPTAAQPVVPLGVWGGTGIRIEVRQGDAKIEMDAAHGKTSGPLVLDGSGAFDVAGTFALERPGPTRAGDDAAGEPARFRGTLDGDTLTMTVTLGRSATVAGPLTARRGARARLRKMY